MRKILAVVAAFAIALCLPLTATAQSRDHIELGAFADYVRLGNANDANYWGIGGRLGLGISQRVNLEGDLAYDFEKTVLSTITGTNVSGATITTARSNGLRLLHGEFGPMLWVGSKHARLFLQAKGGFISLNVSNKTALTGFTNAVTTFGTSETNGVFYPGGGAEISLGPLGLRLDIGDLMYFSDGAHNNLSIKIGPTLHF
jgi:hypothetical protein